MLCAQCRHDPAPPWNSTSTGALASPQRCQAMLPSPQGVCCRTAARSSRSRNASGPWLLQSFIVFPFVGVRERLGTQRYYRQGAMIVFIGDIHRQWQLVERGLAALDVQPRAAVLLGDIECDRPLDVVAAPLLD